MAELAAPAWEKKIRAAAKGSRKRLARTNRMAFWAVFSEKH
jgi:hypothetical protein